MQTTDELLENSLLTEGSILRDLRELSTYYSDMEVESRVVPALEDAPLPSLVAVMETDRTPRVLTHSFLPLDREEGEFTKFLQFYSELPGSLDGLDRTLLLEAVCRLNEALPFGTCVNVPPDPELGRPRTAAVRALQGFPIDEQIDQGVFTEAVFLFALSWDLAALVMDGLREGKGLDEAFSAIGR